MGLDSTKLAAGIEALAAQRYGAEWDEFASPAVIAQTETLETLRSMYDIALQREQEAAERERQRLENERVARELAEERQMIAEQKRKDDEAAEAKRIAEAAAAKLAADAMAEAQRKLAADQEAVRAEAARLAAIAQDQADRDEVIAQEMARQRELDDAMAKRPAFREPTLYDLHAVEAPPGARQRFEDLVAEAPAAQPEEATIKLGDVCARIGVTMSAEFVTETLGVPRRVQGGRAVLFYPSDFERIRLAFIEHLENLA